MLGTVIARSDIAWFEHRLKEALADLHPDPGRIRPDQELCRILVSLYDTEDVEAIWATGVAPYLRDNGAGLRNVWDEHAKDPSFELLNSPEALLVFERAEHASVRLRRSWPGPASSLARICDIWGVAL
jgi:hypothetical protein